MHTTGDPEEPLADVVDSAERSLKTCLERIKLEGDGRRMARGIVMRSLRNMNSPVINAVSEKVSGIAFGPEPGQILDGVVHCGEYIAKAIQEMFP